MVVRRFDPEAPGRGWTLVMRWAGTGHVARPQILARRAARGGGDLKRGLRSARDAHFFLLSSITSTAPPAEPRPACTSHAASSISHITHSIMARGRGRGGGGGGRGGRGGRGRGGARGGAQSGRGGEYNDSPVKMDNKVLYVVCMRRTRVIVPQL